MRHEARAVWGAAHKHRACGDQDTPPVPTCFNSMPAPTGQKKHKALNPPLPPEANLPGNLSTILYTYSCDMCCIQVCNIPAVKRTDCWEYLECDGQSQVGEPHEASAGHWWALV